MEIRYSRINFQLPAADCKEAAIQSWIEVLEIAVNWSYASEYNLFFNQEHRIIGVSIPVKNEALELLEVGAALGTVKLEVVLSDLKFENLWLSVQDQDTDLIEAT